MDAGISDVVQVIRIEMEMMKMGGKSFCFAVKAGKDTLETAKRLALLFANLVKHMMQDGKYGKRYGRTNLDNLLAKTNEKGGFTALRFDSAVQMDSFTKKAGKTVLCAPIPSMSGKDGSCYLGVANTDLDMAKEVLGECMKEWIRTSARDGSCMDESEAEKIFTEKNREVSWAEYINENGFMDMQMQEYEKKLAEQYGDGCIRAKDLKKNPSGLTDADREKIKETADAVKKASLAAQSRDTEKYVTYTFEKDEMPVYDRTDNRYVFSDRTDGGRAYGIPADCICRQQDRMSAVMPRDMALVSEIKEGTDKKTVKAGAFFDGYRDRLRIQGEKRREAYRHRPEAAEQGKIQAAAAKSSVPARERKAGK